MESVIVYGRWQGVPWCEVHPRHCKLKITDPVPVFVYRQNGQTKVSRAPLYNVEWTDNMGRWDGVARADNLARAAIFPEHVPTARQRLPC